MSSSLNPVRVPSVTLLKPAERSGAFNLFKRQFDPVVSIVGRPPPKLHCC